MYICSIYIYTLYHSIIFVFYICIIAKNILYVCLLSGGCIPVDVVMHIISMVTLSRSSEPDAKQILKMCAVTCNQII